MVKDAILTLGNYTWKVLEIKDSRALLLTEDIVELRWYHSAFEEATWADCELRRYLNDGFYHHFSEEQQAKIMTVTNKNPDNPWFKTRGGIDTIDMIFLLSLQEVCEYLGDSRAKLGNKGRQTWLIDDENNGKRKAKYGKDYHWWQLRSPGYYGCTAV